MSIWRTAPVAWSPPPLAAELLAAWLEDEPLPVARQVAEACHPSRFPLRRFDSRRLDDRQRTLGLRRRKGAVEQGEVLFAQAQIQGRAFSSRCPASPALGMAITPG